jgi:hypothetical protein
MADLRKLTEKQKAQYNAQKSVQAQKYQQQSDATGGFGQGLLDVVEGGARPRAILGGLLGGDTTELSNAWNEVKQLGNPAYMKNIKGISSTEAIDIALDANPVMAAIVKNEKLANLAKNHFGTTFKPQETGFILDDGTRLDFSGRHEAGGYKKVGDKYMPESGQPDYLRGERATDHRTVTQVIPNSQYGWDSLSNFIDQTGAVRYMPETGVSMVNTNKPSEAQLAKIVNDFRMAGNPLLIDIDHAKHGSNLASGEFDKPTLKEVSKWINEQYGLLGQ